VPAGEELLLGGAAGVGEGALLPGVELRRRLPPHGVGEGEVHVVAAEEDVIADGDALELEIAARVLDGDEGEVGGAAAHVADEDDVARAQLLAPAIAGGGEPGVERR